jgi:hypothetical protein
MQNITKFHKKQAIRLHSKTLSCRMPVTTQNSQFLTNTAGEEIKLTLANWQVQNRDEFFLLILR